MNQEAKNYKNNMMQKAMHRMFKDTVRRAEIGKFNFIVDLRWECMIDPTFATKFVANASCEGFIATKQGKFVTLDWDEKAFHRRGSLACDLYDISCQKYVDEMKLRDDFMDLLGDIRENKTAMSIEFDVNSYDKFERRWFVKILLRDGFHVRRNKDTLIVSWASPISERTMNLVYG